MSEDKILGQLLIAEGIKKFSSEHRDLSYMLNWLNMRLSAAHIKSAFETQNYISKQKQESVFNRFKSALSQCEAKETYLEEINQTALDIIEKLQSSKSVHECVLKFEKPEKYNIPHITSAQRHCFRLCNNFFRWKPIRVIKKRYRLLRRRSKPIRGVEKQIHQAEIQKLKEDVRSFQHLFNSSQKDVWLIGERDGQARDCGYALFEYLAENHPELEAYYLIDTQLPDFKKVKTLGNWVPLFSPEHTKLFFQATHLICTHSRGTLSPWANSTKTVISNYFPEYDQKKYVMIQHGINVGNFTSHFHKSNTINANFSLLVSGAQPEFEFMKQNFGYQNDEVVYTGLARYDRLFHNMVDAKDEIRNILVMPTWRANVVSPSWRKVKIHNDIVFLKSEYYKSWIDFLNSDDVLEILKDRKIRLYFYPHPEVQPYIKYFISRSENVTICEDKKYDLPHLIDMSDMLITDYSSVFFDFAYANKPILHYHFDYEDFYAKHYSKGYFDFKMDAMGEIATSLPELTSLLLKTVTKNTRNENIYAERRQRFFPLRDNKNCQRIVRAIRNIT